MPPKNILRHIRKHQRTSELIDQSTTDVVVRRGKDGNDIPMHGITKRLKKKVVPPTYSYRNRRADASSRDVGSRIHRHIFHQVVCLKEGECKCGKVKTRGINKYAKQGLAILRKNNLEPIASEVPIFSYTPAVGTRLDMICEHTHTKKQYVISLKTGTQHRSPPRKGKKEEMCLKPLDFMKCDPMNLAQLQGCMEIELLKQYDLYYPSDYGYYIMFVGNNPCIRGLSPWFEKEACDPQKTKHLMESQM